VGALFLRGGLSDHIGIDEERAILEAFPRARIETVPGPGTGSGRCAGCGGEGSGVACRTWMSGATGRQDVSPGRVGDDRTQLPSPDYSDARDASSSGLLRRRDASSTRYRIPRTERPVKRQADLARPVVE